MAEMKFNCPGCGQLIACDELWGGHQIQCPICSKELIVPQPQVAPAAAAAAPSATGAAGSAGNTLVPKVPTSSAPKLSIGSARHQPASPPPQASAHSTLAKAAASMAAKRKKENPWLKYVYIVAGIAAVGAGVYFALPYVSKLQKKTSETEAGGGGQVGHISELNNVLDATDPDRGGGGPRRGSSGSARSAGGAAGAGAANVASLPVVAPTYSLDAASATIPDSKVNGTISGTNFVAETSRLDPSGPALVLSLYKGDMKAPDSEVLVYLYLKPGEKPAGHNWTISPEMKGTGVPRVAKRWKIDPRYAPRLQTYSTGYAMKLELGEIKGGFVSGKIFLALPDTEKTVVAGMFNATTPLTEAPAAPAAAAQAAPQQPAPTAARTAAPERYGVAQ